MLQVPRTGMASHGSMAKELRWAQERSLVVLRDSSQYRTRQAKVDASDAAWTRGRGARVHVQACRGGRVGDELGAA